MSMSISNLCSCICGGTLVEITREELIEKSAKRIKNSSLKDMVELPDCAKPFCNSIDEYANLLASMIFPISRTYSAIQMKCSTCNEELVYSLNAKINDEG